MFFRVDWVYSTEMEHEISVSLPITSSNIQKCTLMSFQFLIEKYKLFSFSLSTVLKTHQNHKATR